MWSGRNDSEGGEKQREKWADVLVSGVGRPAGESDAYESGMSVLNNLIGTESQEEVWTHRGSSGADGQPATVGEESSEVVGTEGRRTDESRIVLIEMCRLLCVRGLLNIWWWWWWSISVVSQVLLVGRFACSI